MSYDRRLQTGLRLRAEVVALLCSTSKSQCRSAQCNHKFWKLGMLRAMLGFVSPHGRQLPHGAKCTLCMLRLPWHGYCRLLHAVGTYACMYSIQLCWRSFMPLLSLRHQCWQGCGCCWSCGCCWCLLLGGQPYAYLLTGTHGAGRHEAPRTPPAVTQGADGECGCHVCKLSMSHSRVCHSQ